jgi:hypothetical protein
VLAIEPKRKGYEPDVSPENGRSEENEKRTNQIFVSTLDQTTHDIINQSTERHLPVLL